MTAGFIMTQHAVDWTENTCSDPAT